MYHKIKSPTINLQELAMDSKSTYDLHFLLIPFLAPGHTIPMIEMAKLLGQQPNVAVTIVTTPFNAIRYGHVLNKPEHSVNFLELPFPATEAGLPEGCESLDTLPSPNLALTFLAAVDMLQSKLEHRLETFEPRPNCIVSDKYLPWTANIADKYKYHMPRIIFDGMSCFKQLCGHNLYESKVLDDLGESETFIVPGLPDRIELTRVQLPPEFNPSSRASSVRFDRVRETELGSYGIVINSFEELEQVYVNEYKKLKGGKVWCIGPLSLWNDNSKAKIGKNSSVSEEQFVEWLDSHPHGSVVYACLGSVSQVAPLQLIELGLGLEASNHPFIWVIRAGDRAKEVEEWIVESGFEERIKGKGLLVRGWAPQVLILSHPSVGGFLTHCGWNSILESVCAGVPMITWPQFAEQFLNEKLVVQVLGIGVSVGAQFVVHWGEEEKFGVKVKSEDVNKAILKVMDLHIQGVLTRRSNKSKELGKMANTAIEEGGSSYKNLRLLIQDIREHANAKN